MPQPAPPRSVSNHSLAYYNEHDAFAAAWLRELIAGRVGRLRGYGNALCAPAAQAFIEAYLEIR